MSLQELDYTGEFIVLGKIRYSIYQEHINRYLFAANFVRGKRVLDIACGTGYGADFLARSEAFQVIGGDISVPALKYACRSYHSHNLVFIRLDATKLPFQDKSFDIIVSFETIEHLDNPREFLWECFRVLKKSGVLICSTPNRCRHFLAKFKPSVPFHKFELDEQQFRKLLGERFTIIDLWGQCPLNVRRKLINTLLYLLGRLVSVLPCHIWLRIQLERFWRFLEWQILQRDKPKRLLTLAQIDRNFAVSHLDFPPTYFVALCYSS